jgi:hypothetical protein
MAYDSFYSDLSTRGSANEILNLAVATKKEIEAASLTVVASAESARISANEARGYALQAQQAAAQGGGSGNLTQVAIFNGYQYGITGGASDQTDQILAGLDAVRAAGGGILVCRSTPPGSNIKIDGAVNIEGNNTTLIFESPIEFGPEGFVRFNGRLAELYRPGQVEAGKLSAASYVGPDGRMVLPMTAISIPFFQVGDRITIRGQNNKNGAALQRQVTTIAAINGLLVTCSEEPDYTFQPVYPNSAWPPDATTGTTVIASVSSMMTADVNTRTDTVSVADTAPFTVGDLCYISDSRTEADMMAPEPSNLLSAANMEIYKLVGINGTAKTLTFERALLRSYLTSFKASVVKMDPVSNSHIIANYVVTWPTPQSSRKVHSFATNYANNCSIRVASAQGKSGKLGASVRVAYSYNCHIYDSNCFDAYRFESAEGYGLTLYYSTFCSIRNCRIAGMRHNILLQTCTSCDVTDNISSDDYISGIDLHGAGCMNCKVARNRVGRSRSFAPGVTNGGAIRNGNTSHTIGDHGTIIEDNIIEGYNLNDKMAAIDVSPSSQDVIVRNNDIIDCGAGVRHYNVNSSVGQIQRANRLLVEGNTFTRVKRPIVMGVYANSIIEELVLIDNISIGNTEHFKVVGVPYVRAYGNKVVAPVKIPDVVSDTAFIFDTVTWLSAYNNISGPTSRGIALTNVQGGKVVRNFLSETTSTQMTSNGSDNVTVSLNGDTGGGAGGGAASVNGKIPDDQGNITLTKTDLGLGNVENTAITTSVGNVNTDFVALYQAGKA